MSEVLYLAQQKWKLFGNFIAFIPSYNKMHDNFN